ncbi:MAG: carbohydrate ABC transporter permease [Cellulosilyticaceae bacterium]
MKNKKMNRMRKSMGARVGRSATGNLFNMIILLLVGAFMVLPLVYTICNAFKPMDELYRFPPKIFVMNPTLNNFSDLSLLLGESWVPFARYVFNTVTITVVGLGGHIVCASMAAYALEKRRFPGREGFFKLIVATLMFTPAVTQIPNFIIMQKLGWVDSLWSVIVPAFGAPIGLYLMKQFMAGIPDSLLEAAKIDGASEWAILWQIVMPNVKPAWLTLSIFTIQSLWNATGGVYIFSEEKKTLSYAMSQIVAGGVARAGAGAAVGVIMLIVPITVFIISQSNILQTMASSGIKE